jgi:hypothetical protein
MHRCLSPLWMILFFYNNQDNTSNSPNNHAYVTTDIQIASSSHSSNTANHNTSPNVSPPSASSSSSFPASASSDASPSPILPLRKSTRNVQPPTYLQDYHCHLSLIQSILHFMLNHNHHHLESILFLIIYLIITCLPHTNTIFSICLPSLNPHHMRRLWAMNNGD